MHICIMPIHERVYMYLRAYFIYTHPLHLTHVFLHAWPRQLVVCRLMPILSALLLNCLNLLADEDTGGLHVFWHSQSHSSGCDFTQPVVPCRGILC